MKPAQFEYLAPRTVDEAVGLLDRYAEDDAKILAGGQSLVPLMNFRLARPKWLIDVNMVAGLSGIRRERDWLVVGATTRQRDVEHSQVVRDACPLLADVTRWIGHVAIRNRGTVGGCLAHNDPTAEYPLAAMLLGASLTLQGPAGSRTMPAEQFFLTYLTTALAPNELLTEARFPVQPAGTGWAFHEFARRHGDFAIVEVGALLRMHEGRIVEARLAVGGAGPVAFRAAQAEQALIGQPFTDEIVEEAGRQAAAMAEPESDIHASAEYRRHLTAVLTRRALHDAFGRAV